MVTYLYNIDSNGRMKTVQTAIDLIAAELESFPTIERDIVVTVARGLYGGFRIPDGALQALSGTSFRLVIRSAGNFFPIFDYNISQDPVGLDLGSANPNIRLERLRVQHFAAGIRAGLNSHFPIVKDCLVTNNRNVGIWIEQCDQAQVLQNVVVNGDYGVVFRLCKDAAAIHNTVFLDGTLSNVEGVAEAAIWGSTAHDYGGGLNDTGKLHVLGNILWNMAGPACVFFHDDVDRGALVSEFNDIVLGQQDYIVLQDRIFYVANPDPRRLYNNLRSWKDTGNDQRSISADPKFVQPSRIRSRRNGLVLDLSVLSVSPALGIVPSFFSDPTATSTWLPSYVDSSNLSRDILGNSRQRNGTAAGANDRPSSSGFFGQDVFTNPLDLGLTKECDLDPLRDLIDKKIALWFPRVSVGYFYGNEREYYLYARKRAQHLSQIASTFFELPEPVVQDRPVRILVSGIPAKDFDVVGNTVVLRHGNLPIHTSEEEAVIQCTVRKWVNGSFQYNEAEYVFKIREGETRFLLDQDYVPRGPVVVTDDNSSFTDIDELANREFSVEFDPDLQQAELVFAQNSNLALNSQFDYVFGPLGAMQPLEWESTGAIANSGKHPDYSVMGDYRVDLSPSGSLSQVMPTHTGKSSLSWHSKDVAGHGTGKWSVEFFDADYNRLGYVKNGTYPMSADWTRQFVVFGATGDLFSGTIPEVQYPVSGLGYFHTPDNAHFAEVKFSYLGTGTAAWDAVQYELEPRPTPYHRRLRLSEMTVEYETSEETEYVDRRQAIAPVRSHVHQGFLYIPEVHASLYEGPEAEWITTLFEYRWPEGRKKILPWARTSGKDKLRKRVVFHTVPEKHRELVSLVNAVPYPGEITLNPDPLIVRIGDTNGHGLTLNTFDQDGNPYALAVYYVQIADINQQFPGWLSKRLFGLKQQLGQSVFGRLDNAGNAYLTWIPPTSDYTTALRKVPRPSQVFQGPNGERISSFKVPYAVNLDFHGNITLKKEDGSFLSTQPEDPIRGTYLPVYSKNTSRIRLDYPVVPGTVQLWVGGVRYTETVINSPETNQFFVDTESSTVHLKGRVEEAVVEYIPSFVFVNESDPARIMIFHDQVFGDYLGHVTIGYDISIRMDMYVQYPGEHGFKHQIFELIGQNPMLSETRRAHPMALEF